MYVATYSLLCELRYTKVHVLCTLRHCVYHILTQSMEKGTLTSMFIPFGGELLQCVMIALLTCPCTIDIRSYVTLIDRCIHAVPMLPDRVSSFGSVLFKLTVM